MSVLYAVVFECPAKYDVSHPVDKWEARGGLSDSAGTFEWTPFIGNVLSSLLFQTSSKADHTETYHSGLLIAEVHLYPVQKFVWYLLHCGFACSMILVPASSCNGLLLLCHVPAVIDSSLFLLNTTSILL